MAENVTPPDTNYLVFGFWRQVPRGSAANARPTVLEAFYAGSDPFKADNVTGLTGTATYAGNAVGRYAYRAEASDDTPSPSLVRGNFDAVVSLSVDFGTASQVGTIRGSIGTFTDDSEATITGLGTVGLPLSNISATGTFSGGKPTGYTGGSWSGQFFGNGETDDENPTSAAGKFEGWKGSSSGDKEYTSLEGSFGADR